MDPNALLIDAVKESDLKELQEAVDQGATVDLLNDKEDLEDTILHLALMRILLKQ